MTPAYTPHAIYISDKILQSDTKAIAQKFGWRLPLSQANYDNLKQVVQKAKDSKMTVAQYLKALETTQRNHANAESTPDVGADVGDVNQQISIVAQARQKEALQDLIRQKKQELVMNRVAENLAYSQLELSGWDLEDQPDLREMLGQSEQVRGFVEAQGASLLPFSHMVQVAFQQVPALRSIQSLQPMSAPLLIEASQPTNQPTD